MPGGAGGRGAAFKPVPDDGLPRFHSFHFDQLSEGSAGSFGDSPQSRALNAGRDR